MTRDEAERLVQRSNRGILTMVERQYLVRVAIFILGHMLHRIDPDILRGLPPPDRTDGLPPHEDTPPQPPPSDTA